MRDSYVNNELTSILPNLRQIPKFDVRKKKASLTPAPVAYNPNNLNNDVKSRVFDIELGKPCRKSDVKSPLIDVHLGKIDVN